MTSGTTPFGERTEQWLRFTAVGIPNISGVIIHELGIPSWTNEYDEYNRTPVRALNTAQMTGQFEYKTIVSQAWNFDTQMEVS